MVSVGDIRFTLVYSTVKSMYLVELSDITDKRLQNMKVWTQWKRPFVQKDIQCLLMIYSKCIQNKITTKNAVQLLYQFLQQQKRFF